MKSKLTPFDGELLAMIADIMKFQPTVEELSNMYKISVPIGDNSPDTVRAMQNAVRGRLGKRLIKFEYFDHCKWFYVAYMDAESMPDEMRTDYDAPDATAGTRYCRTLKEVDAIQVDRDNLEVLKRFTGGGTMTIPRKPGGIAKYSFPSENGVLIDAPETWFIIRESNGRLSIMSKQDFERDYEPKGICSVGNDNGNPVPLSGAEFMQTFSRLFGTNIESRNHKLTEEYGEYMEAANAFIRNPEDRELYDAMVDELSDLSAVVFHIAGIIGKRPYELLRSAYDKVIGRQADPNYRRKHPHKTRCCGECSNLLYEDVEGAGYCVSVKDKKTCDQKACGHYEPKKQIER